MDIVAQSDTGRIRRNNEDAVEFDLSNRMAVLADGMGGLDAGEVASSLAVETIMTSLSAALESGQASEDLLRRSVVAGNLAVHDRAVKTRIEMGTTVVVWLLTEHGQCFIAHVGDSRAYRLRAGELRRLTTDHSMVQQMIDEGLLGEAEAQTAPNRNVITRALGLHKAVQVDVRSWVHSPGDLYLLCSDGLTDLVAEAEIGKILQAQNSDVLTLTGGSDGDRALEEAQPPTLEETATLLVRCANEAGGHDNISVLLIQP